MGIDYNDNSDEDSEMPLVINEMAPSEETRKRPADEESEGSEPGWVVARKSRIGDRDTADEDTEWVPPKHQTSGDNGLPTNYH